MRHGQDGGTLMTPQRLAQWCRKVSELRERSYNPETWRYDKRVDQCIVDAGVPEDWRVPVQLMVSPGWSETWEWADKVDPVSNEA